VFDYDGDGSPDLYFVNDRVGNRLFHNRGGGRFEETTAESGAGVLGDGPAPEWESPSETRSAPPAELLRDELRRRAEQPLPQRRGRGLRDAGQATGADEPGLPFVRWGTHLADFDNDGWPDLYAVGGHLAPRIVRTLGHYRSGEAAYVEAGDPAYAQPTTLLHNDAGRFSVWRNSGDLARVRMVGEGAPSPTSTGTAGSTSSS
jgi:hypothetical protein